MGRIVSIDFGLARLGIAISDERKVIATSVGVFPCLRTTESTIQSLLQILSKWDIETILIGYPIHMDGRKGFLADEVTHFADRLKQVVSCKVILWDERLSTVQADRSLREANLSRKKRSKVIDAVSAVILLQSYIESLCIQSERQLTCE